MRPGVEISAGVVVKFRQSGALPAAGFVALIGSAAFAAQQWWTAPILLIPLAIIVYGLRSGVDADRAGLRVRSGLRTRRLPWTAVDGFSSDGRRVVAQLINGVAVRLPAIRAADVPRLLAAGDQPLDHSRSTDSEPTDSEPGDSRGGDGSDVPSEKDS